MDMPLPIVSVGLQFFNNEKTLETAIRSILQQSFREWELIVHDDGSRDRSAAVVGCFHDPRIRFFPDWVNRQRPYRLNQSLELAQGQFYAVMDADDVAYPERLEKQVQFLIQHPDVDLVGGGMMVFASEGMPVGKRSPPLRHEQICRKPWTGFPMAQPTFMGRIGWFRLHKYNASFPLAQDQDLLLRSYRSSRFANLPEIVTGYREDRLSWMRLARGRNCLTHGICRQLGVEGRPRLIPEAVLLQAFKSILDGISVLTGLDYRLLRHRARFITGEERQKWRQVYQSVTP
jgi:glycosyltransferase involved in cell wall biosynthesis